MPAREVAAVLNQRASHATLAVPAVHYQGNEARPRPIALTPEERLAFWQALEQPASLTPRKRELGRIMRGER